MPSGRPRKTRWDVHCTPDKECEVMWVANASCAVSSRNCNARHGAWHGVPPKTTFAPQVVVGLESYTPKKDTEAPLWALPAAGILSNPGSHRRSEEEKRWRKQSWSNTKSGSTVAIFEDEEATSQGIQEASRNQERWGSEFFPGMPRRSTALMTPWF